MKTNPSMGNSVYIQEKKNLPNQSNTSLKEAVQRACIISTLEHIKSLNVCGPERPASTRQMS